LKGLFLYEYTQMVWTFCWRSPVGIAGNLLAPPFAIEIIIFSIYTMGCNFLLGRVGFISFGQPAYLAVGAWHCFTSIISAKTRTSASSSGF
jgi:ABC-type branched-subunit amino acid transport system permease subunit